VDKHHARVNVQESLMDGSRFDTIAKLFASRRLSRRQAVTQAGSGVAAGALAAVGLRRVSQAQESTPAAGGEGPTMLFLQAFQSGGITPAEGTEGRYTLTLEQGLGHTVYFSDRPERIVGAHPTPTFLAGLGFPEDNPPNAALVVETGEGQTEIAVVELFNPRYDEGTHTATYDVVVLGEWERSSDDMSFIETDANLAELLPEFGAAHLFIDDCPDGEVWCSRDDGTNVGSFGILGHCYSWPYATCLPCSPWYDQVPNAVAYWSDLCEQQFPACGGQCGAVNVCVGGLHCNPD
jgi:hypothetical protein